jgi:hypothetical protein
VSAANVRLKTEKPKQLVNRRTKAGAFFPENLDQHRLKKLIIFCPAEIRVMRWVEGSL